MTALFGGTLAIGFALLVLWVVASSVAGSVEGREDVDPERRFGPTGRFVVAALVGFGMAGLSASFAGWPLGPAVGAAVLGAAGLAGVSAWLGPREGR